MKASKKAVERSSKPSLFGQAATTAMEKQAAQNFLNDTFEAVNSGENVLTNRKVTITAIALKPDIAGVLLAIDKADDAILREYGVPRFLVNKTPENRATAFVEFEGYVAGIIEPKQRYFKRALEAEMWYDRLVQIALKENGYTGEDVPVKIKHNFRPVKASDIQAMGQVVAALFGNGNGLLAEFPEIAFEMMNWNQELLKAKEESLSPAKTSTIKGKGKE